ncbi:hypothetical protein [Streptomyces sp. NPDC048623]|uniref:hypothetical protein n=1 Tax=Streptomyces sp. NPDC048623 TaxID=3155761 RepID=UPI003445782D
METYTLICEWAVEDFALTHETVVIVVSGETHKDVLEKAAKLTLEEFPELAEKESARTFWESEFGLYRVAEFYGDATGNLVDKARYHIIKDRT